MAEELKKSITIALDKPGALTKHFPITRSTTNGQIADDLIIFYSKLKVFENKIYIIKWDISTYLEVREVFNIDEIEDALIYVFDLHHETTNSIIDNEYLFIEKAKNNLAIVYLFERNLKNLEAEIRDKIDEL